MSTFLSIKERAVPSSSGLFGLVSGPMGFGRRNSPLRLVVRPFSQDAGGFGIWGFFARLLVNEAHHDGIAGAITHILHGRSAARLHPPGFAPFRHRKDDLPKGLSGLRGFVFVAWRIGLIRSLRVTKPSADSLFSRSVRMLVAIPKDFTSSSKRRSPSSRSRSMRMLQRSPSTETVAAIGHVALSPHFDLARTFSAPAFLPPR